MSNLLCQWCPHVPRLWRPLFVSDALKRTLFPQYHMQIHFHVDKTHAFCARWHDVWAPKIWLYLLFAACAFKRLCSPYLFPSLDMESAIKTLVTTFLGSARGKDNLNTSSFKKMVQKQLGNIMEVKSGAFTLYHHVSGYTKIYLYIIIVCVCVCMYYFNYTDMYIMSGLLLSTTGHRQQLCHKGNAARAGWEQWWKGQLPGIPHSDWLPSQLGQREEVWPAEEWIQCRCFIDALEAAVLENQHI